MATASQLLDEQVATEQKYRNCQTVVAFTLIGRELPSPRLKLELVTH